MAQESNGRWDHLLAAHHPISDSPVSTAAMAGKTVLLTGAGGCIGSALAQNVLSAKPRELLLLDHSEQALYQLGQSIAPSADVPSIRLLPGSVGDTSLIAALLKEYRPDLIVHAAAYKHVPLMEENPFAAVQNNAIFTWQLAKAAAESGVPQFLLISTDKAANPYGVLGTSKRVAEQAVLRWNAPSRWFAAVRLVNVLGSSGSVLPLFVEQIRRDGPLTITHPNAARHFLTLNDTVRLILAAAALPDGGVVYVPKLFAPVRIVDLAKNLLRQTDTHLANTIRIEFTGLRPGEKIVEEIVSAQESVTASAHPAIDAVTSPRVSPEVFDRDLLQLKDIVERRDLVSLFETLRRMVPDYQPGSALCPDGALAHD